MNDKKNTSMAVLAYFLFFLPLLTDAKKDAFVRFHVRQSLGLLITFFALRMVTIFLISPLFYILGALFGLVLMATNLFLLVLFVMGVMNASKGEKKPLPVIGEFADKTLKI